MRFGISNDSKGFTLIEMVMVITLLGIIGGIIALPLYIGTKGWFEATTREGITESGRIAIERMMREIRNTARKANNTTCISAAAANSLTFSDLSGDMTNCNSITFSLSGTNLLRCPDSACATQYVLANNVSSFTIKYYKSDNSWINEEPISAANRPLIRRLAIEVVSTQGTETMRKYSEVYLSNMRGY